MRCPVDGTTLALTERAGVGIDYPACRGVRLDRGELDWS
jgi:Zn-finger nucleic acid-binding protein